MLHDQSGIFTDRSEAQWLFQELRGRDPSNPWPLLPILSFIAPAGGGKSELMRYLSLKECCLPDGRPALPFVYVDFSHPDAPKDFLSIFVAFRNQLRAQKDALGRSLMFPRFDLGAAIALATSTVEQPSLRSIDEIRRQLTAKGSVLEPFEEMGNALGNLVPVISPLLVGLRWAKQTEPLKTLLYHLESGSGWRWYREQRTIIGLPSTASISDVLLRLHVLNMPHTMGKFGRKDFIEQILPAAFLADLYDALNTSPRTKAWSATANVVLFLDSFDALLSHSDETSIGIPLLEQLALSERRRKGETDGLLLVLASQQRLLSHTSVNQDQPFECKTDVQELYKRWQQHLPPLEKRRFLRLNDLYLPLWLNDFNVDDIHHYLSELSKQEPSVFGNGLAEVLHKATHGHPLYLALATTAIAEAKAREQELSFEALEQMLVSPEIAPFSQDKTIRDYVLTVFLRQFSKAEQNELIFCAVPRAFDVRTLRVTLQLSSDREARERWLRYRSLTLARVTDNEWLVFHPLFRDFLLQQLRPDPVVESDYYQTHLRLREYFRVSAQQGNSRAKIEEAYHALALGDPQPAVDLATYAIGNEFSLWERLLEAVAHAPHQLIPAELEQLAADKLNQAMLHHHLQDSIPAIIFHVWLSSASHVDLSKAIEVERTLTERQDGAT